MVVFNCNACGEALKKNQVEKHYMTKCRQCEVLSCVDCGKEFWGNDYEKHTKCVSEEVKYGGKNFKPKANANKGEQKQELWISQVQAAVSKVKTNAKLRALLEQLVDYPNIPRKKAKFENFLRNSLRVYEASMASAAWDAISAELSASATNNSSNGKDDSSAEEMSEESLKKMNISSSTDENNKASESNRTKTSNPDNSVDNDQDSELNVLPKQNAAHKKKKNKKHRNGENGEIVKQSEKTMDLQQSDNLDDEQKARKKKEKKKNQNADVDPLSAASDDVEKAVNNEEAVNGKKRKRKHIDNEKNEQNGVEEYGAKKKKLKSTDNNDAVADEDDLGNVVEQNDISAPREGSFKWEAAIIGALKQAPEHQLKVKKLRKKVLAEFNARQGDGKVYTEESLLAKFNQKLANNSKFKVKKDIVKLNR